MSRYIISEHGISVYDLTAKVFMYRLNAVLYVAHQAHHYNPGIIFDLFNAAYKSHVDQSTEKEFNRVF